MTVPDRSESARLLLELDEPAPAGVEDLSGQSAIVWMIIKMPPVVSHTADKYMYHIYLCIGLNVFTKIFIKNQGCDLSV